MEEEGEGAFLTVEEREEDEDFFFSLSDSFDFGAVEILTSLASAEESNEGKSGSGRRGTTIV